MNCFFCDEKIKWEKNKEGRVPEIRYKMEALEIPYKNLFFHIECHAKVENMLDYLMDNLEKVKLY